jgi:hypothetical protein
MRKRSRQGTGTVKKGERIDGGCPGEDLLSQLGDSALPRVNLALSILLDLLSVWIPPDLLGLFSWTRESQHISNFLTGC